MVRCHSSPRYCKDDDLLLLPLGNWEGKQGRKSPSQETCHKPRCHCFRWESTSTKTRILNFKSIFDVCDELPARLVLFFYPIGTCKPSFDRIKSAPLRMCSYTYCILQSGLVHFEILPQKRPCLAHKLCKLLISEGLGSC